MEKTEEKPLENEKWNKTMENLNEMDFWEMGTKRNEMTKQ